MVETHTTGVGQVIDNQRVAELPLNGRQATELIFLSGLATSAPSDARRFRMRVKSSRGASSNAGRTIGEDHGASKG